MELAKVIAKMFGKWDDKGDDTIYLIPKVCYEFIPDGTELINIYDEKKIKGKDYIDDDTRFGRLAWGLTLNQINDLGEEVLNKIKIRYEDVILQHT
ncbi:MAG: hypothetical protein H7836_04630 [Magnetococcus sp. YQC-3]